MMSRAFRSIAGTLAILLLTGAPTHAAPVAISEVIQVLGSYSNPPKLRLRSISQTTNSSVGEGDGGSAVVSGSQYSAAGDFAETSNASNGADSLLAGIALGANPQRGVDVVDEGNVEGTICDCGEITVPGGGVPKWPLLFLAAIPLFFVHSCDHCDTPTPFTTPPAPTPPSVPAVPEPSSLLLLGSALAAFGVGLRRRYAKAQLQTQLRAREEG
jgi:hypothetical protein